MKPTLFKNFSLSGLLVLFLVACQGVAQKEGSINQTISPTEFEAKLKIVGVQLIDVRSTEEYSDGGIGGSTNIPINSADFESRIGKLDKNKPVLVYCLSGGRSGSAAKKMNSLQFKEVYNLDGGLVRWRSEGKKAGLVKAGMSLGDYEKAVNKPNYVLVDFNATWCAPCKKMLPWLTKLADTRKADLELLKVDADEHAQLLTDKGIKGIPYLELYKDGKLIWKQSGLIEEAEFRKQTGL